MTNREKYLKDGVDTEEFVKDLHYFWWANEYDVCEGIRKFLNAEAKKKKPTLTEDERVILENVGKDYQRIERDDECLWVRGVDTDGFMTTCYFKCYDHLFQFIKERRRIFY